MVTATTPLGIYNAVCGHLLMMVTTLHQAPNGKPCAACAAVSSPTRQSKHHDHLIRQPSLGPPQPSTPNGDANWMRRFRTGGAN
jgi:hypothetical protein